LIDLLKQHEIEYQKSPSEYYYQLRDIIRPKNDIEKAARFIALNRTCYNGLYRRRYNFYFITLVKGFFISVISFKEFKIN
jgi:site-specific DNA-adenine methylase